MGVVAGRAVENFAAAMEQYVTETLRKGLRRQRCIRELWDRAVSRGEVQKDIDLDLAMDLLFGPTCGGS
jgi:hypothetical protein